MIRRCPSTTTHLPKTEKDVVPAALSEFERDPSELNLEKFLNGELTTQEYLATVPEVEI